MKTANEPAHRAEASHDGGASASRTVGLPAYTSSATDSSATSDPVPEYYGRDAKADAVFSANHAPTADGDRNRLEPACDASLVYVPSKSSKEDIQEQVKAAAYAKEHFVSHNWGHMGPAIIS